MPLSMEELKAAFKKPTSTTQNTGFWNMFYPFYKMEYDAVASFRFLPDQDENNPRGFIVENHYHEVLVNGKKKRYACLKMYGHDDCPLCAESRKHYDAGDEALGKTFYRKIDYIGQGIVTSSPFDYPIPTNENPVRLISLTGKLFEIIAATIGDGDFDETPYHLTLGRDFRIKKTKQGEWANYTTSSFAGKTTPIAESILDNENFKLFNLKDYRYAKVDADKLNLVIESVLTGKSIDEAAPAATGHVTGNSVLDKSLNEPSAATSLADAAPAVTAAPAVGVQSAADKAKAVLERIRRNQAAS